jgi:hypothetical protein
LIGWQHDADVVEIVRLGDEEELVTFAKSLV